MPNKPTVVGSRGQIPSSGIYKKKINPQGSYGNSGGALPTLNPSGGVSTNTPYKKSSMGRPTKVAPQFMKYGQGAGGLGGGLGGGGLGGGLGSGLNNPYSMNYNQNS